MRLAIVTERSTMPHNRGERFYRIVRILQEGTFNARVVQVVDPMRYPWAWGFRDIAHALAIVDMAADDYGEINIGAMIDRFAAIERAA